MTTPPRADSPEEQARYVTHDQTLAWIGPPPGEMPGQGNNGRPQLREEALERREKLVVRWGDGIYPTRPHVEARLQAPVCRRGYRDPAFTALLTRGRGPSRTPR